VIDGQVGESSVPRIRTHSIYSITRTSDGISLAIDGRERAVSSGSSRHGILGAPCKKCGEMGRFGTVGCSKRNPHEINRNKNVRRPS